MTILPPRSVVWNHAHHTELVDGCKLCKVERLRQLWQDRGRSPLDERHVDDDDVDLIPSQRDAEPAYDVIYSWDVFLLMDAMAKLARCRYVVRNHRGIILDTDMLCDRDIVLFDRQKYEKLARES